MNLIIKNVIFKKKIHFYFGNFSVLRKLINQPQIKINMICSMFQIQVISGVILVAWQQKVLERQIDYGAKIGHVVLSLAKMELNNFYKNVIPVADYFDERGMLIAVRRNSIIYVRNGLEK